MGESTVYCLYLQRDREQMDKNKSSTNEPSSRPHCFSLDLLLSHISMHFFLATQNSVADYDKHEKFCKDKCLTNL